MKLARRIGKDELMCPEISFLTLWVFNILLDKYYFIQKFVIENINLVYFFIRKTSALQNQQYNLSSISPFMHVSAIVFHEVNFPISLFVM